MQSPSASLLFFLLGLLAFANASGTHNVSQFSPRSFSLALCMHTMIHQYSKIVSFPPLSLLTRCLTPPFFHCTPYTTAKGNGISSGHGGSDVGKGFLLPMIAQNLTKQFDKPRFPSVDNCSGTCLTAHSISDLRNCTLQCVGTANMTGIPTDVKRFNATNTKECSGTCTVDKFPLCDGECWVKARGHALLPDKIIASGCTGTCTAYDFPACQGTCVLTFNNTGGPHMPMFNGGRKMQ